MERRKHPGTGVVVAGQNISYSVGSKTILDNVNFLARPGHLMVIMGPSGSGKTTLLNALAGRLKNTSNNRLNGIISFDGDTSGETLRKKSVYVMQEDHLEEFLTVRETLHFAARLKLAHSTATAREERVDAVINDLELGKSQNVSVGGPSKKGLSGGQKKRVSIASAMLGDPQILFLDEPTSGLDSSLAYDVFNVMIELAKSGRTVVCTLHQPRSQVFALFDELMLLSEGRVVFSGPADAAEDYFKSIGHSCPKAFNPADFFLDLLSADSAGESDAAKLAAGGGGVPTLPAPGVGPGAADGAIAAADGASTIDGDGTQAQGGHGAGGGGAVGGSAVGAVLPSQDASAHHFDELQSSASSFMHLGRVVISKEEISRLPYLFQQSRFAREVSEGIEREMEKIVEVEGSRDKAERGLLPALCGGRVEALCTPGDSPLMWFFKFGTLTSRMALNTFRNPFTAITQFSINVIFGLALGGVFFMLPEGADTVDDTITAQRNRLGYLFFIAMHFMWANMDSLLVFPRERITFNRETAEHLYDPSAYFLARSLADLAVQQLPGFLFSLITYLMAGMGRSVGQFFVFVLVAQVMIFTSSSYCYMFGAGVKDFALANITAPVVAVIFVLVGGFYLQDADIPAWIAWLRYINYLRFAFFALFQNEMRSGYVFGHGEGAVTAEQLYVVFGIPTSPALWVNTLIVFVLGVGYRIIAFLLLKYVNRHIGVQA